MSDACGEIKMRDEVAVIHGNGVSSDHKIVVAEFECSHPLVAKRRCVYD